MQTGFSLLEAKKYCRYGLLGVRKGIALMGHIQFLNQDNEWESFPSDEEEANLRANAEALEELGYMLICQLCNVAPTWMQIRKRWIAKEWTCDKCHTINSAGRA